MRVDDGGQLLDAGSSAEQTSAATDLTDVALAAPIPLAVLDGSGRILAHNLALASWLGVPRPAAGELVGLHAVDWLDPGSQDTWKALLADPLTPGTQLRDIEVAARAYSGGRLPALLHVDVSEATDGSPRLHVALVSSTHVTTLAERAEELRQHNAALQEELRRVQEQLRHHTLTDHLTGLANRTLLEQQLGRILAAGARAGASYGVICLDLDGFRDLRERIGQDAANHVLRAVADRLRGLCPAGGVVSRLGGDVFALAVGPLSEAELEDLARRCRWSLQLPYEAGQETLSLTGSFGAVLWEPRPGEGAPPASELVALADRAVTAAKRAGGNAVTVWCWNDAAGSAV